MPSTFTTNLGVEKPGSGEQSGAWGDTVNINMDILDRASNGAVALTLSGATSTLTTSDGSLSNGQNKFLRLSGTPGGTHTITVAPNDAQKIYFVTNATNQSVVISQGSGATVTILAGDAAAVYCNGAGAGAAVTSILNALAMGAARITGGTISGITDLAVADGGTGSSTAAGALTNLGLTATAALLNRPLFGTQAEYTANTTLTYTAAQAGTVVVGDNVLIAGEVYVVVASNATVFTLQTTGGGVRALIRVAEPLRYAVDPAELTSLDVVRINDGPQASDFFGPHDLDVNDSPAIGAFATTTTPVTLTTGYLPVAFDILALGTDGWLVRALRGAGSFIRGRAGMACGYLATITSGHDNGVSATGGQAMGAANFVGNPWHPRNINFAFWGYLSAVIFGRDNLIVAFNSGAGGQRNIVAGGGSNFAVGHQNRTGNLPVLTAGLPVFDNLFTGQIAVGFDTWARGDGAVSLGKFANADNGIAVGWGINTGTRLQATNEVGMGNRVRKPTIVAGAGAGASADVGSLILRVAPAVSVAANGINIWTEADLIAAAIQFELTNSGSGGSYTMQLDTRVAGVLTRGFDIGLAGTMSLVPATDATHRLASAARRFAFGWINELTCTVAVVISSDARLKRDITDLSEAELAAAGELRTRAWVKRDDGTPGRGYVAQEIIDAYARHGRCAIEDGLVVMGADGYFAVRYSCVEAVRAEYFQSRLGAL